MEQWLTRLWYEEAAGSALLQPLAWAYGAMAAARQHAYAAGWLRTFYVGRPVIVVGNLTVGGTGKTPLVAWLARQLTARGLRVGIVSRGHGSRGSGLRAVTRGGDWRHVGDEPMLLHRLTGCEVYVAADRVAAARAAAADNDVIISDDGLQHLRLARDCEIVVVDGLRGFGNGRLLPAGPLRERPRRLARVDLIVVNGDTTGSIPSLTDDASATETLIMHLVPGAAQSLAGDGAVPLEVLRGERVHAVAGIGNPQRFFRTLRERGIEVLEHVFADHHPFAPHELEFADGLPILMTEKDAVRCAGLADARMWFVPVEAQFSEADSRALLERVVGRVHASSPPTR